MTAQSARDNPPMTQALRALLARHPDSIEARLGLAKACVVARDLAGAAAWLSDACRVAPTAVEPASALAEVLLAQEQFAQALPVYDVL